MSTMLVRVSHRLSLPDWEALDVVMADAYAKANVEQLVFGVKSANELPFIEHALQSCDGFTMGAVHIKLCSFDQVVALMPHSMRLLKALAHSECRLEYWQDTDRKTSQLRWQLDGCDTLLVVRAMEDGHLFEDDIDMALELDMTVVAVDLGRGRMSRLTRKEG